LIEISFPALPIVRIAGRFWSMKSVASAGEGKTMKKPFVSPPRKR
jgi:hypothetical protein